MPVQLDGQRQLGELHDATGKKRFAIGTRGRRGKTVADPRGDRRIVGMAQQGTEVIGAPAAQDETLAAGRKSCQWLASGPTTLPDMILVRAGG
ncbi:hypothetical protein [Pseudoxanthomonas sp. JBR18]|uniref:hypothetical protein n=1 Tax=Pseudoxanthomonas sp. JBR18 TaxID=2969308 RepID=UPI00230607F9|nr:hypothetical protein [Pseudoxanthomonas sp. JBR18]WCE05012.1 hypothetical protein PJ250_03240 [Pseudoxanthomonas sp. JBR18]